MDLWHAVAAVVEAVLLIIGVLLLFDTLRERTGWSAHRARRAAAWSALVVPAGVVAVLVVPAWVVLILLALPALIVGSMAMAN